MKNNSLRKSARELKVKTFSEIYTQEYLRNYRPAIIIKAISARYIVPEQTIRDYIKPARLRKQCEAGKHLIDINYVSIIT